MTDINEHLSEIIKNNKVVLFMKGTPEMPQCGFSMAVSNVLKHLQVQFTGINVLEDEKIRNGIKEYSNWPTVPQLYVNEEFIGGCDIIKEMFEKKELQKLFEDKKISFRNN
ncbi:MAG: Grx4 family monothiol glutaredoxin [alpha proteobacterium HIMB114]|jgi:monothiol glutaredoxin|nr:monothiol glutaredoxin, Grx4 family [Candidatus Pelagibacter sp.]OUV87338.1 MAG: monothiol glutaredoxin, Grx4 family [Pelagibacteraceae bacterium TMED136]RZO91154.1 MAG: Grx4 family monothiol glutaredoxin [alpha proteobacterium HIMB114]|tara:strand:- start:211 stop:543 length:333 start_codon:yes stop_codon:yes gene_type:complete